MKKNKNRKINKEKNKLIEKDDSQILEHVKMIREEIYLKEIKLNALNNDIKEIKDKNFIFIDEGMIINKPIFEVIGQDLICSICNGMLYDPISCSDCETCFCKPCIQNWLLKDNQCVMRCKSPLNLKEINRMTKIMLEKLILNCSKCGQDINLLKFPTHQLMCENEILRSRISNIILFQENIISTLKKNKLKFLSDNERKFLLKNSILEQKQNYPYCGHKSNDNNLICRMCKDDDIVVKIETSLKKYNNIYEFTKRQILLGVKEMQICGICCQQIKRDSSSIQCSVCYSIQHYKCLYHDNSGLENIVYCDCGYCNNATIRCKICKFYFFVRDCIECYCAKNFYLENKKVFKGYGVISTLEEKLSGYSNQGKELPLSENNINKSCGLICGKKLCSDKICELICHPGPHMICEEHSLLKCYCGSMIISEKICESNHDDRFLSCQNICNLTICDKHSTKCNKKCFDHRIVNDNIIINKGHSECYQCGIDKLDSEKTNNQICFFF